MSSLQDRGVEVTTCRHCGTSELKPVLDLGHHPPADSFLTPERLGQPEASYPLRLVSCRSCGLLQIDYLVAPEILYQDEYPYESSTTRTGRTHYHGMARQIVERFGFGPESLALDIGSNVGVLLQGFVEQGLRVLGVDPAHPAAERANHAGIETLVEFFNEQVAEQILSSHGPADVLTGTNVFAHIHELHSAVRGMKSLLSTKGILVIEAPHSLELVEHLEYDTIYHEHIAYLSVKPMAQLVAGFELQLFDVEPQTIHGGTLRYYLGHPGAHPVSHRVGDMLAAEEISGLYDPQRLQRFGQDVRSHRLELITLLTRLKSEGKTIAGVSAPAKGNTLLNYCHIDDTFLDFLTEKTEMKIGRYTPGTHLPVFGDEKLLEAQPDYALILAWNFADEIMANLQEYRDCGGQFILPIPTPRIVA